MDENVETLPESERLQFSLKAFFIGTLIVSVVVGLIVLEPLIFLPITAVVVLLGLPTWCFLKKKPYWGFLFMVSFILLLPVFSFVSTIVLPKLSMKRRIDPDKKLALSLSAALQHYYLDHQVYPGLGTFKNSSAALYHGLQKWQASPYIDLSSKEFLSQQHGEIVIVSKMGDELLYSPIQRADGTQGFVVVLPGKDRLLGGKLDTQKGFIPDNSDSNGDGIPDHTDNIIEQVHKD